MIDVGSGKQFTISSSKCKVNLNVAGWIDGTIADAWHNAKRI
jgi:hypothetical protein